MKIQFQLTIKYLIREIALLWVKMFFIALVTFLFYFIFSIKIHFIPSQIPHLVIVVYAMIAFAFLLWTGKKSFINTIICEKDKIITKNIFGRIYELDLKLYFLKPNYLINVDTNQLTERKLEVVNKETGAVVNYLFENVPTDAFLQVMEYYSLDTSGLTPREEKELPLNNLQRSNRKTVIILGLMFPSVLLLIGTYVFVVEQNSWILGLGCLFLSISGLILSIYKLVSTNKRRK
jgi:hypothetical protein